MSSTFKNCVFTAFFWPYHYGTCILKTDLTVKRIINYNLTSFSDTQAVVNAIHVLKLPYVLYKGKCKDNLDFET